MAAATVRSAQASAKKAFAPDERRLRPDGTDPPDLPVRPARPKMALILRLHPRTSGATQLISYIRCTQIFSSTLRSSERHLSPTRFSSRATKAACLTILLSRDNSKHKSKQSKGQTASTTTTINDVVRSPPLPRGPVNDLARNRLLRQSRVRPPNNAAILTAVYTNE